MFKQILPLSSIIGLRFFGLFVVLPVLSSYAIGLDGANAMLAGIVMGGYAITQAVFQVPFGHLSDKIGRKNAILVGSVIFLIGSVVSALSTDIYMLMLGRFLQGTGAVGAVVSAMISDLVREEQRSHAMAMMGGTIAMSFVAAMIISPLMSGVWGVPGLFWLTAALTVATIIMLYTIIPESPKIVHTFSEEEKGLKGVLADKQLGKMYITFLFHSSVMTMAFFLIPLVMTSVHDGFGWTKAELWKIYLPAVFLGMLAMGPSAVFGEKYGKGKQVFIISIILNVLGFLMMGYAPSALIFGIGAALFFIGFMMFEPLLQSFVSKMAKTHQKGLALGIANTFGYIGTFLGGILAGYVMQHYTKTTLAWIVVMIGAAWIAWIISMKNPNSRGNVYLPLDIFDREKVAVLKLHPAIVETYINETENIAIIKYEKELIDEDEIRGMLS